jgi:putative tricarboxylic transport membrane protein
MPKKTLGTLNPIPAFVAIVLFAIAAITYWDASSMVIRAGYGMGANATSYFVAVLFVLLAIGHLVKAFQPNDVETEHVDWAAVTWISLGLAGLIASIWNDGGFILGATLLFACTARAFGRRAFLIDLLIGFTIGVFIFLLFNKLLTLALPQGLIERLF